MPSTTTTEYSDTTIQSRIALITGANKGIGFEVAQQLGAKGHTILLTARNETDGHAAVNKLKDAGTNAHYFALDVTIRESVRHAAEMIEKQFGKIDILVNNAGTTQALDGLPSVADESSVRRVFDVNYFGVLAVTQEFLPLLRKSAHGRIVMVSSSLGSLTRNSDPSWYLAASKAVGYNGSKALVNMLTVQLAWELRETNIKVNAVNPGYVSTDMTAHKGALTVAQGAAEIIRQCLVGPNATTGGFFQTGSVVPW